MTKLCYYCFVMILPDDKLKELLLGKKLLGEKAIAELSEMAKSGGLSLQEMLTKKDPGFDEKIAQLIAAQFNLPVTNLAKLTIADEVLAVVPERVARANRIICFARDKDLVSLATTGDGKNEVVDMVAKKTGQKVKVFFTTEKDLDNTLQFYKKDLQKVVDNLLTERGGKISANYLGEAPITRIVDTLIRAAYDDKASDVHIEPEGDSSLIRFRIDGVLHDILRIPKELHDHVITRIKVLSNLRTDEHLSAQDGKMQVEMPEENLDIRISILPVVEGEKVVLRLLSSKNRQYTLTDLGMSDRDLKIVTRAFSKSFGMILATGPTGSGKTTTIYSVLKILNQRERNLTTIEDPVEYRIEGANQVQVNAKTNLTFANGLRSILRQDPNIIFVGEIRDGETADISVNAALTGHLVFSTLHTNDSFTAIPRLIDMGVEPFLVASTVNIIVGQRLIRKICESCRVSMTVAYAELEKQLPKDIVKKHYIPAGTNKEVRIYKGRGCKVCHFSGYLGRIGIFEVLEVNKKIRELITQKAGSDAIIMQAVTDEMTTMLDDGLGKVAQGVTTLEEVLRVTKTEFL